MPVVVCEHCRTSVEVDLEHLDAEVQCGRCGRAFVAKENHADSPKSDPKYDDEDDRPTRRRVRYFDDEFDENPEATLVRAREMARGPALALMIVNALALLLLITVVVIIVITVLAAPPVQGGPAGPPPAGVWILIGFYGIYGLIAVSKMVLGFLGGRALMGTRSYGWAMAGAIATVVPLDGCMSLIFVPFGIWALVVLQKPEVKWAMRRNAKRES